MGSREREHKGQWEGEQCAWALTFAKRNIKPKAPLTKQTGKLGIPIDEIPVALSGSTKSGDTKTSYTNFCSSINSGNFETSKSFEWAKTASATLATAWTHCMDANGFQASIESGANPEEFRLVARFRPTGEQTTVKAWFTFSPNSVSHCGPDSVETLGRIGVGVPIGPSRGYRIEEICTRNSRKGISIAVNGDYTPTTDLVDVS